MNCTQLFVALCSVIVYLTAMIIGLILIFQWHQMIDGVILVALGFIGIDIGLLILQNDRGDQ